MTTRGTAAVGDEASLTLADAPPIDGLRFRRPRGDDAEYEAIAELIGAASRTDDIPWFPSASMVRQEWELDHRDEFDPRHDAVIADVDGRIVAVAGSFRQIRAGEPRYRIWGHVDPAWRRRGLGTALLLENVRRADERATEHGDPRSAGRPEIRSLIGTTAPGDEALLRAAGLVPIRWTFLMRRPTLDDIPDAPLPAGLEFRTVATDHHRAIALADDEAFRDHWEPEDFREAAFEALFSNEEIDTGLWVAAWDGDEVAGSVQSWVWRHENEQLAVRRGWLESISVRRPWRRRGVARAMTAEALRKLRSAGMDEAMLGVDADNPTGALGLYEGLGFVVDTRMQIFGWPPQP